MSDSDKYRKTNDHEKKCKKYKTITTSEFIIVLLFIYLAVTVGMFVKIYYFN